jgi:hypothetical protein
MRIVTSVFGVAVDAAATDGCVAELSAGAEVAAGAVATGAVGAGAEAAVGGLRLGFVAGLRPGFGVRACFGAVGFFAIGIASGYSSSV